MNEIKSKKCPNCGAPITGNKCLYCGSEFENSDIEFKSYGDMCTGKLIIGGKEFDVYLGEVKVNEIGSEWARDISGKMYKTNGTVKRQFVFTEM